MKLQPACNATKFSALAISFCLIGCSSGGNAPAASAANQPPVETYTNSVRPNVTVSVPRSAYQTGLHLIRDGKKLYFGELEDNTFNIFRRPSRAQEFFEEPPITGDDYNAHGWQSPAEAFGAIFLQERLVLAQFTLERGSFDAVNDLVTELETENSAYSMTVVPGKVGTYRFWESDRVRLMSVVSFDGKGKSSLTIVLGDVQLMNALRMSQEAARQDLMEASRIFDQKQEQSAKPSE